MTELFDQLDFVENPLYERIIYDIATQKYSIVEHFFTLEEVSVLRNTLRSRLDDDAFKKAAIGNKLNEVVAKKIRGDYIFWMNEASANTHETTFFSKINNLINYLNRTCFLGILHKEFHYALYPKDAFYKRHLDSFQNDDRRKLSFVCYLNDEDWQPENGGELVLYLNENNVETERVVYPFPGRVVIFESQIIEHEVKPVKTERLSITGWLKTR